MKSAPALSLPPLLPLFVSSLCRSVHGDPQSPVGGEGGEARWGSRPPDDSAPHPKKCSSSASQHAPLPARAELAEEGGRGGEGGADGRASGGGVVEEDRVAWSDTGGGLCGGLLFAVPQASRLLLVAHTHLLRHVHQRTGHRQTYTNTHTHAHKLLQLGDDYAKL